MNRLPTYIRLVKVSDAGKMSKDPNWGPEAAAKVFEKHGGKLVDVWATLGPWDFVAVVEAPDNETMAVISAKIGALLGVDAVTMPATPSPSFMKKIR